MSIQIHHNAKPVETVKTVGELKKAEESLSANSRAFKQLEADEVTLINSMKPAGVFTQQQKDFWRSWFLEVSNKELNQINEANPKNMQVTSVKDLEGTTLLNGDLLTDSDTGKTYGAASETINDLKLVKRDSADFPPPPDPDI